MFFGILTLITALTIAGVAAWFSIAGLIAIFSASATPIAIMAGSLEVGKLLTASWLYRYWNDTSIILKSYLCVAVGVLMLITSMGIFGYLSKAHLDQSAVSGDALAQVERVSGLIERQENNIEIAEDRIAQLRSGDSSDVSESIRQQETIRDSAYDRVQGDIDYAQEQINNIRQQLTQELAAIDAQLERNLLIGNERLAALDDIVESYTTQGTTTTETRAGGVFRAAETETVDNVARGNEVREQQRAEREQIANEQRQFQQDAADNKERLRTQANNNISAQQANIDRYRSQAEQTVQDANREINNLRNQSNDNVEEREERVRLLQTEIDGYYDQISNLRDQLFEAQSAVRSLETEVGPIKYVAQLIYGADSTDYLDKAVTLFILMLVFVFDPLAVMLVIAANQTLLRYGINLEKAGPDDEEGKNDVNNTNPDGVSATDTHKTNNQSDSGEYEGVEGTTVDTENNATETEEQPNARDRSLLQQQGTTSKKRSKKDRSNGVDTAEKKRLEAELKKLQKELAKKPKEVVVEKEKIVEVEKKEDFSFSVPPAIAELEKRLQEKLNGK